MNRKNHAIRLTVTTALAVSSFVAAQAVAAQRAGGAPPQPMSFFVTSVGMGNGANLGGLAGADAYCQKLAAAVNAGDRTWRAYLSTQAKDGVAAVNARDRIGKGPWHNQKGAAVAKDVADLHLDNPETARLGNNLSKMTAIDETGAVKKGFGDSVNEHDILTGSTPDGRAYTDAADHTCGNWTSNATGAGRAQLGHFDRTGGGNTSWNSAHQSRGCSQPDLIATGGAGFLYCFVAN